MNIACRSVIVRDERSSCYSGVFVPDLSVQRVLLEGPDVHSEKLSAPTVLYKIATH